MEEKITQRGFYFLLGILVVCIIWMLTPKKPQEINPIQIELKTDSIKKDTVIKLTQEFAPVSKPKLTAQNVKKEIKKHKIPHSDIVLAQAKLESGNFNSKLTKSHNNIFGLKTGNNYTYYTHWSDCVADYKKRISSRYKGGNYYVFLSKIGYAEDPNYISTLKTFV
jgi:uncharacterized membrane protein YvbJ